MSADPPDDLARVERWVEAGGTWELLARQGDTATLALCRCDGGEETDRLTTSDRRVLDYLLEHPESGAAPE